jgi:hypothetical protein
VAARNSSRSLRRAVGAASGIGGMLCSRRTLSSAFHLADDGDSGAGCGRAADSRGVAAPGPGDFGRCRHFSACASSTAWVERRRLLRWLTERRAFRGEQDRRSGQPVCDRGQESWLRSIAPSNSWRVLLKPYSSARRRSSSSLRADLVAQAEHDPDALCILITSSRGLAKAVQAELHGARGPIQLPPESLPARSDPFGCFA